MRYSIRNIQVSNKKNFSILRSLCKLLNLIMIIKRFVDYQYLHQVFKHRIWANILNKMASSNSFTWEPPIHTWFRTPYSMGRKVERPLYVLFHLWQGYCFLSPGSLHCYWSQKLKPENSFMYKKYPIGTILNVVNLNLHFKVRLSVIVPLTKLSFFYRVTNSLYYETIIELCMSWKSATTSLHDIKHWSLET